jgi:pyrroline-5-carboxylate reductase
MWCVRGEAAADARRGRGRRPHLTDPLLMTIAAGIRIDDLSRWLGGLERIVRAMPNTPALVHAGVTGLYARRSWGPTIATPPRPHVGGGRGALVRERVRPRRGNRGVGKRAGLCLLRDRGARERRARARASEGASRSLALWTFVGATKLAIERGEDPADLRAQVTSRAAPPSARWKCSTRRG